VFDKVLIHKWSSTKLEFWTVIKNVPLGNIAQRDGPHQISLMLVYAPKTKRKLG
jgi:hypothetical protein